MRTLALVLGCLMAFAAVAMAESGVHKDADCKYTYHDNSFWRNCTVEIDGETEFLEVSLSWESYYQQFIVPAFAMSLVALAAFVVVFFGFIMDFDGSINPMKWKFVNARIMT